ncbi:HAMP domain-containing histidine kinase [Paenibacillus sp. alder61]|uniref:sensor histidine kinase n=1 Tax=Paenibacillus sp. alder61 TaxID=2862948 RepID=UPI001CD77A8C|nr:HAMP domain-containing sensor histidine kinase [Paenibacillus sp. alder61]MCA1295259.1 HAMP domain-containing histidine kinase [Paenibacillus sp. alder61]
MRTLRIRTFTLLCFLLILFLPWIFFVTAHYVETGTVSFTKSQLRNETGQTRWDTALRMIESGAERWTDPLWQNQLLGELQKAKIDAAIQSASGVDVYRSNPQLRGSLSSTVRYSIMEDGRLVGRVVIYLPKTYTVQLMSAIFGFGLALLMIGLAMRRFLLKPLEKMSAAARQIASGDWNVQLPGSGIAEIAEVRDGFEVMVQGLQSSHRKQLELEEERRFVIAAVAHDLRTPLFALRGYLDGLERGIAQSPEKISRYLAVCQEKSAQLDRLVEDLFTYTKMEYLGTDLQEETIDLGAVLRKSMESLAPLAREKRISITMHGTDECMISGDAHLLERAMNNILENAVRYTPSGGEVNVQYTKEGDQARFSVRDTGAGFNAEEMERVFEPLYRGEASRSRSTGGSGLGLTISQRIIRRHGGQLAVGNHSEGGAIVTGWIRLKSAVAHDPENYT